MTDDELLRRLSELEQRSAALLDLEQRPKARSWADLESRLGLEPLETCLGLRAQDHYVSIFAGLAGGFLDLRSSIADSLTSEELHQRIDAAFKDKVRDVTGTNGTIAIDNAIGGPDHRLVGPTHDLFRLFKTVQLVRRGEFEAAVMGVSKLKSGYRDGLPPYLKIDSGPDALILVLMHWSADFFSSKGLPIPGWSKLAEVGDRDFVALMFKAYREGANLRAVVSQFLSNMSGLALISIILHIYRYIDLFYITEKAEFSIARCQLGKDLRFRWMSRNANLTALCVTTGQAVITQNYFSWNYLAFMKFFADGRAVESMLDAHVGELDRRTDVILAEMEAE